MDIHVHVADVGLRLSLSFRLGLGFRYGIVQGGGGFIEEKR